MTSKTLNFYIIFHTKLFKDNLEGFTDEEKEKWFSWVAVNEKIPKEIPDWVPQNQLLYEYKLPKHNPMYQMLYFYQNSFLFHLYQNPELMKSRYVGFGQYDMKFNSEEFRSVMKDLENDTADKIVGFFPFKSDGFLTQNEESIHLYTEYFLKPYEEYFQIKHTLEALSKWPLFLLHTFIIPTWYFKEIMGFIEWNLPNTMRMLKWNVKDIAGTLERFLAICFSAGLEEGRFRHVKHVKGTIHVEEQHSGDIVRGIPKGKEH